MPYAGSSSVRFIPRPPPNAQEQTCCSSRHIGKSMKNKLAAYTNTPVMTITRSLMRANSFGQADKPHRMTTSAQAMQAVAAISDNNC